MKKKLDTERFALKKSHDDLIETQQKLRLLEIEHRELTTNHNQSTQDSQTSTKNLNEQIESEIQRRIQSDKEIKQLQQQFQQSLQKEKQFQEQQNELENENERLTKELRQMNNDYQTIKTKLREYEKQIEGNTTTTMIIHIPLVLAEQKSSEISRTQITELKEEITGLTEKLRLVNIHQKNVEDER